MPNTRASQPNLILVARFLDALDEAQHGELGRGQLQLAAGVNYTIFKRYESLLARRGFILVSERVRITPQGSAFRGELLGCLERLLDSDARPNPGLAGVREALGA